MRKIKLDGNMMKSKDQSHIYMQQTLQIPGYYGKNLDALWDALSSYTRPIVIELQNPKTLAENLGSYGRLIIKVFEDAIDENESMQFIMIDEEEKDNNV